MAMNVKWKHNSTSFAMFVVASDQENTVSQNLLFHKFYQACSSLSFLYD